MAVQPIPEGYHTLTPYLSVDGAAKLIDFLQAAFGASELYRMSRPDGAVGHAELQVGDSRLMLSEAMPEWPAHPVTLYVYVTDVDTAFARAVAAGATVMNEPTDQFYGDRSGGVRDFAGNQWWIATHVEDVAPEELERRAQKASASAPPAS